MEDGRYDQARHLFADRSAVLVEGLKCVSPFVSPGHVKMGRFLMT
jgi:hypothetical protein